MKKNVRGWFSLRRYGRLLPAALILAGASSVLAQRPVVTNITLISGQTTTNYNVADPVVVQVEFDVNIVVSNAVVDQYPYLQLRVYPTDDVAVYVGGGDGSDNILLLRYTVMPGDFAEPLNYPSQFSLYPGAATIYNAGTGPADSWRQYFEGIPSPASPRALSQANISVRTLRLNPGSATVEAGQTTANAWNVNRGGTRNTQMDVTLTSSDPTVADIAGSGTATIGVGQTMALFNIEGYQPGTVWITAHPAGYPAGRGALSNQFTVIPPVNQYLVLEPVPGVQEPPYDEGNSYTWRVRRTGSVAGALTVDLNVTAGSAFAIGFPPTVQIPAGQASANFVLQALDGTYSATLRASEGGGAYAAGSRVINVDNVDPRITGGSVSPGAPTVGQTVYASFTATDVNADIPKLRGTWNWGDGTTTPNVLPGATVSHIYTEPGLYTVVLSVTDTDGGVDEREFVVNVNPGYTLTVNIRESGFNGLANVGTGRVTLEPPAAVTNVVTPNMISVVYPQTRGSVRVTAWPDQPDADNFFNYVFWITGEGIAEQDQEPLAAGATHSNYTVQVALGQDRTVAVLFSREWRQGDRRGDVDGDGLTDEWEVFWGLNPLSAAGPDGGGGSLSGDRMPNAPNVLLPGNVDPEGEPYGGPFGYPIPWSPGWSGYAPVGPLFNNILQFRGQLIPIRDADDPRTDPTVADTSGDGLTDGWLYYFWANATNDNTFVGRAYDPNTITGSLEIANEDIAYYFNPRFNRGLAGMDLDGDGLTTIEEYALGTNPIDWDTDGDGMPDGWEVLYGLDPLNPLDADDNPDNDYMADDGAGNIHHDVYLTYGFDPRTGWSPNILNPDLTWGGASPNTREFTNLDEFLVMRWYVERGDVAAIYPRDWPDWCTDPLLTDTDGDRMPDGWELYVGLNPRDTVAGREDGGQNPDSGPWFDIDGVRGETLTNREEFSCRGAAILYPDLFPLIDPGWLNKFWPTDPFNPDTDGDQVLDSTEATIARYNIDGVTGTFTGRCYAGGGLNPTSADTDGDYLPDGWEAYFDVSFDEEGNRTGMDGTWRDAHEDYDQDGLVNYQEYWVGAVWHFNYDKWFPGLGYGGYDPAQFFMPPSVYPGGFGRAPREWDWAYWVNRDLGIRFFFQSAEVRPQRGPGLHYATTDPTNWDTDGDGMDDYYEMYHALNPLWGNAGVIDADIVGKLPPLLVRDARVQPWQVGDGEADPDQDGIPNFEEMLAPNRPSPQSHHTDPTPLWFTDMSYSESFVNLYYKLGSMPMYWAPDPVLMIDFPPPPRVCYAFSFASNEGYDTDGDQIPDKRETIGSDTPGSTDPLDHLSPLRRRAFYLDGDAAARTRAGFFHGAYNLRSWTVEFWMRPQVLAKGSRQIIVERPVAYEPGDPLPPTELVRRTFRLGLESDGALFVEYDNLGSDLLTKRAAAPADLLNPNVWYHVAGVMDGTAGQLSLYVNGQLRGRVPTTAVPATGVVDGNPPVYRYAPLLVGAADSNPSGQVHGAIRYRNWMLFGPPAQPALHSFYEGWVDEIRVWDGVRALSEMQEAQSRAFIRRDIEQHADFGSGARLLYHYNFSELPDPNHEPVSPAGFSALNGRPDDGSYPGVPWWRQAADRSTVYNDYHYLPWIHNSVAHLPLDPPLDSIYWGETSSGGEPATNVFPNTANPYGYGYTHSPSYFFEVNPEFGGRLVSTGFDPAEDRLYSSLLPLRGAVADADVELWDGGGAGLDPEFDSNGDGIPDWWYILHGYDPHGPSIADLDPDEDGLSNYWEYRLGSSPVDMFSLDPTRQITDADYDSDGDGLTNIDEILIYGTDPTRWDTDDDGISDGDEVANGTNPLNPYDPAWGGALRVGGNGRVLIRTETELDAHRRWTVEAWVRPDNSNVSGIILSRAEQDPYMGVRRIDYELGLQNSVPYVKYAFRQGSTFIEERIQGIRPVGIQWVHLAGVLDDADNQLRLYVNGKRVAYKRPVTLAPPTTFGAFESTIGGGALDGGGNVVAAFSGRIDAVRVWNYPRTGLEIQFTRDVLLPEFDGIEPDRLRAPVRIFNFDTQGVYAHNSRHIDDWLLNWRHAGFFQGDATVVSAEFPPVDLDSDDDGVSDYEERSQGLREMRSESPLVYRALDFDGSASSVVEVDELVDSEHTPQFALTNWTVEAWVRPNSVPAGRAPLVRRVVGTQRRINFEIGVINFSGTARPYARFQRQDGTNAFVTLTHDVSIPTGTAETDWSHVAATYNEGAFSLIVNGERVKFLRLENVRPVVGDVGLVYFGGEHFVGQMHEIRIWKVPRTIEQIRDLNGRCLLFAGEGIYRSFQGGANHLSRTTESGEDALIHDYPDVGHVTHKFAMLAWVKMEPNAQGGIVAQRTVYDQAVDVDVGDWFTCHGLRITGAGQPEIFWEGTVTVVPVPGGATVWPVENSVISEVDIRDGNWHHLAAVGDGRRIVLYIDGVQDRAPVRYWPDLRRNSFRGLETNFTARLPVNSELRVAEENIEAVIDEVMFWSEDLTAEQVRRFMGYGLDVAQVAYGLSDIVPLPDRARDPGAPRRRLASYVTFDGDISMPFVNDETGDARYRILPQPVALEEQFARGGPPIAKDSMDPWRDVLSGYFSALDGGEHVENYVLRNHYGHAGLFRGKSQFTELDRDSILHIATDSNSDGIPDWWYIRYGLEPGGPSVAYEDWDEDGLHNMAEFLAGTDPFNWDTSGDGISDYDSVAPGGARTYGELYADGDGMSDAWEMRYPGALSPLLYDAHEDPDGDGWSNYAEFMAGTDPTSYASRPQPLVRVDVTYDGIDATGDLVIHAYGTPLMDGVPDAVFEWPGPATYPATLMFTTNVSEGFLREGDNWFFAFIDRNGNREWDEGEPAGVAFTPTSPNSNLPHAPVQVGWDHVDVTIGLTDELPGYPRFDWSGTGENEYDIMIRRTTTAGWPTILERTVRGPRTYFHEGDYRHAGHFGLAAGSSLHPGYEARLNGRAHTTFNILWPSTYPAPALRHPLGGNLVHARNEFRWTMHRDTTLFRMQVVPGATGNAPVYDATLVAPYRGADGVYRFTPPWRAGDAAFPNGVYYWRVQARNPTRTSNWSSWSSFRIELQPSASGSYSIGGRIDYFGAATKGSIIVQAFSTPSFNTAPEGQARVGASGGQYRILGLRPGTYYVRAFLDQNNNGRLDHWESFGFVRQQRLVANYGGFEPRPLPVPNSINNAHLSIRDRDTDNDGMSDAWEFEHFGNLTTAGAGSVHSSPAYTDTDGDGLNDWKEYIIGSNPNNVDTDGDGLTDYEEVTYSSRGLAVADTDHYDPYHPVWNPGGTDTDVLRADTDGDTLSDGDEVLLYGMNPINPDDDGDGVPTRVELAWDGRPGWDPDRDLDPRSKDSDGDGVCDLMEIAAGSDPLDPLSKSKIEIDSMKRSDDGERRILWNTFKNQGSVDIQYDVEFTPDLRGGEWLWIGSIISKGDHDGQVGVRHVNPPPESGYYRLRIRVRE